MAIKRIAFLLILIFKFTAINSQIQFAPYELHATSSDTNPVSIGDLNNDGLTDVATVTSVAHFPNHSDDYKVCVYLQNASGQLDLPVKYDYQNTSTTVECLKICDLNNDGRNDVAIVSENKIGILYQNSSGGLDNEVIYTCSMSVKTLGVGDFNGDGLNDLVVSTFNSPDAINIEVLQQESSGGFTHHFYPKPTTMFLELEVTDINNDGRLDLVFLSYLSTTGIYIYIQNNAGTFDPYYSVQNLSQETYFFSGFGVGDLNNDGAKDLVISKGGNFPNAKLLLLYQNPVTHVFESPIIISAFDMPEPVAIADLNNDGENEIITMHGGFLRASVYSQNDSGTYENYSLFLTPYASHYEADGLAIGDINNDNGKDIIGDTGSGLVVLYNTSALATATFDLNENNVVVFPNPAGDFVNIRVKSDETYSELKLYDTLGQLVLAVNHLESENKIDLRRLKLGMYFLKLIGKNKTFTQKIIKF